MTYIDPFAYINEPFKQSLIKRGIIFEEDNTNIEPDQTNINLNNQNNDENNDDIIKQAASEDFPGVDYDLQNQIITFFTNNPGAEPELFREFANSLGIDPDELQFQANILLTQLIQIYLQDAESMGYGDALTTDDEIDPEIIRLVSEE